MNDPPDGDVLSLNADSLTLTAECNHVLYSFAYTRVTRSHNAALLLSRHFGGANTRILYRAD